MHIPSWFLFAIVILISWGVVGLLQKLSTNHLSAESALIWCVVGFWVLQPFLYSGRSLFRHSNWGMSLAILGGFLNALGAWALLASLRKGGKASIVSPLTSMYPLVVIAVAPLVLHESISARQGVGMACALLAVILLSA